MTDKKKNNPGKSGHILEALKRDMDEVDEKIVDLINQRLLLGEKTSRILTDDVYMDSENIVDDKIINRLIGLNSGPLNNNLLSYIFRNLFAAGREIKNPHMVAYLGPEATFSHIAALNHFGHSALFAPKSNIGDIFNAVEKDSCHFGVVPVENSIEGSVNLTLDFLFESDLKICAERYLTISHDLMSISGKREDVKIICSHPQPIAQCRRWISDNLPDVQIEECTSTAYAAQKAAKNPEIAAIASNKAKEVYKLQAIESGIEDFTKNVTRFLVIGKDEIKMTGKDKTSLMFATAHIPGALYKVLEPIAETGINMVKLESRPTKYKNWSYFFFIDIEGHMEDQKIKDAVSKMKNLCQYLKCLGSYNMVTGIE
ncbi:MAG: prephenate dehydratase [Desulfobacterales bacterium]|nr:prephenate dehydratase [Desulfobacteraceae bacterium]MBT4365483.1 prephenate dehydratase [Desulfobacteraceae bacterium]MBT7087049.1 prephenate dehydratase [Desulfobacterales bacterium]MBT7697586.1 prephenate dehydratase [Desulfobacterales bacterium]